MESIQDLHDFIDRAAKSHKYPDATAWNLKHAIKKYESFLNEEERASVRKFKENLDPLTQKLFNKDKGSSASSVTTYKSRVAKAISDFEKYGSDAARMANWTVKPVIRTKRAPQEKVSEIENVTREDSQNTGPAMARIELPLRPNMKFVVIVPHDITVQERTVVINVLNSLNIKGE